MHALISASSSLSFASLDDNDVISSLSPSRWSFEIVSKSFFDAVRCRLIFEEKDDSFWMNAVDWNDNGIDSS